MTIFDYVVIAIVGVSTVLGVMRGAVKEVFSLAGWVIAFIVAKALSVQLSPLLESMFSNSSLRLLVAFVLLFVVTLIAVGIIGYVLTTLLKKIGLGPIDRALGSAIGLTRGLLIMLVLVVLGGMTALPQQKDWRHALTSSWFEKLATAVTPWLPEAMVKRIHFARTRA
ncbi:MAG: CvpA family protein [Burkholderiales bacterium]